MENRSVEIRQLANGYIEVVGKIPYNSPSQSMFSKDKRIFFTEYVAPLAYSTCLEQQKEMPMLIFNHDMKNQCKVISFDYKEKNDGKFEWKFVIEENDFLIKNLGKIKNFSYGFTCLQDEWSEQKKDAYTVEHIRRILSFASIAEFSLLTDRQPCFPEAKIDWDGDLLAKYGICEDMLLETNVGQYKNQIDQLKNSQTMKHYKNILQGMKKKSAPVYSVEDARQYIKSKKKC